MSKRRYLTAQLLLQAAERYAAGATLAEISRQVGFSVAALSKAFKRSGVPTRPTGPRPASSCCKEQLAQAIAAYRAGGTSLSELSNLYGTPRHQLAKLVKEAGIPIRRKWSKRVVDGRLVCGACGDTLTEVNSSLDVHAVGSRLCYCNKCRLRHDRRRNYGVPTSWAAEQLKVQGHVCAVCSTRLAEKSCCVDHSHSSGQIRGLLCRSCNLGLGSVADSATHLRQLCDYLQAPGTQLKAVHTGIYSAEAAGGTDTASLNRFYKYGVTQLEYESLKERQGCVCACCGQFRPTKRFPDLVIEHCHDTGVIRGLTCQRCNRAAALFGHDAATCAKAIQYLERGGHPSLRTKAS